MGLSYEIKIYKGIPEMDYQISSNVIVFSVLEGSATFRFEKEMLELTKGEVYVMNFGKLYSISSSAETVIAEMKIDYVELLKTTEKEGLKFYCNTKEDTSKNHYEIKKLFSKLISLHVVGERYFDELSLFYELLGLLTSKYAQYTLSDRDGFEDDKINQVCLYLHTHYKEKITLDDICDHFAFSTSTFTRNFKKQTNKSMIQYLNEIRIQSAKQLLLEKNSSVTDVALEVGFSDSATFIKKFKQINGISPLKFKQKVTNGNNIEIENDELLKMVEGGLLSKKEDINEDADKIQRKNEVAVHDGVNFDGSWTRAIGVQNAHDLLSAQYQKSVLKIRDLMGLKYIRLPLLFTDYMVYQKDTEELTYDFSKVDAVLDFILQNRMLPIIELSGRTRTIVEHDIQLAVKEENVYSYSDEEYEHIIESFMNHILVRFSGPFGRMSDWMWEYQYVKSSHSFERYLKNFNKFSNEVHRWQENHLFGGYGLDIYNWEEREIANLSKNDFNPDFISVAMYPYEIKKRKGNVQYLERCKDAYFLRENLIQLRNVLDQYGYGEVPIYVTEWNTTLEDSTMLNDSYVKASHIMTLVTGLMGLASLYVYDTACDLVVNPQDHKQVLFGGKGLISKDGIEKSALAAMAGLSRIGEEVTVCNDRLLFSYVRPNNLVGICFNRKAFDMSYYQRSEMSIHANEISKMNVDEDILEQTISISHLLNGTYRIRLMGIAKDTSALTHLGKIGNDVRLGFEDLQYLRRQSAFNMHVIEKDTVDNCLEFALTLKPNEMVVISILPLSLNQ